MMFHFPFKPDVIVYFFPEQAQIDKCGIPCSEKHMRLNKDQSVNWTKSSS